MREVPEKKTITTPRPKNLEKTKNTKKLEKAKKTKQEKTTKQIQKKSLFQTLQKVWSLYQDPLRFFFVFFFGFLDFFGNLSFLKGSAAGFQGIASE